jgi:quercetin dioxygenase-like cupin family protein
MSHVIARMPVRHFSMDGVRTNVFHVNAGEGIPRHDHAYAHATVCYAGRIRVTKERVQVELTKDDQPVVLRAGEWHEIEALEDGTVFTNVFAEAFMQNDAKGAP